MLKVYGKKGFKVTTVQRIINFKQDYICGDYIENNTNKRATAKIEADKDTMKLMNYSLSIYIYIYIYILKSKTTNMFIHFTPCA